MLETPKWKGHLVVNRGPNTLLSQLEQGLKGAQRADISVAFVSLAGLERILPKLQMVAKRRGVRFLTGFYQYVTQPTALRKLLQVSEETKGLLSARISRNACFHAKLYLMNSPGRLIAVIGSSNLSDQGLLSDGEIDLSISLPVRDQAAEQLAEEFNRVFRDSLPLTKELIEDYSAGYELLRKHGKPKGLPKISGILKQSRKTDDARPDDATPAIRWWRDSIYGYAEQSTKQIIERETDWEIKGWQWHCLGQHRIKPGDLMLLLASYVLNLKQKDFNISGSLQ